MSIDRAWSRRPLVSEPYIGRLVPPLWTESQITIYGAVSQVDNGHGGFTSEKGAILTTRAHVEIVTTSEAIPEGAGPVQHRFLRVIIPWPTEEAVRMPTKGDQVRWTADTGRVYTVGIRTVTSPETLGSHLEMESEAVD